MTDHVVYTLCRLRAWPIGIWPKASTSAFAQRLGLIVVTLSAETINHGGSPSPW